LSQIQNGKEVVTYKSKHSKPFQLNYVTTEKEALAGVFAIKSLTIVCKIMNFFNHKRLQASTCNLVDYTKTLIVYPEFIQ